MTDRNTELPNVPDLIILGKNGLLRAVNVGDKVDVGEMFVGGSYFMAKINAASTRLSEAMEVIEEMRKALGEFVEQSEAYDELFNDHELEEKFMWSEIFDNGRKALTTAEQFMKGEK